MFSIASLLGPKAIKFAIIGIIALAVVTIIGLGYRHYTGLLAENNTLKVNQVTLETAVKQSNAAAQKAASVAQDWAAHSAKTAETLETLSALQGEATETIRELKNVLSRHDLEALAAKKPVLVQRRINAGTTSILRELEDASRYNR